MPIKVTVTGTLEGEIRQVGAMYVFEVACQGFRTAPKNLPLPGDGTATVLANEKQMRPCRALIEQGDKVIVQGELCLDVPARHVRGDIAVVAYSLSTVALEAQKKAASSPPERAEIGSSAETPVTAR